MLPLPRSGLGAGSCSCCLAMLSTHGRHSCVADANPFLQSVHRCMTSRLLQLPDKHSVTALLNTWAQSIHQACLSAS